MNSLPKGICELLLESGDPEALAAVREWRAQLP